MIPDQLEEGYWQAYRDFYSWRNIARGAAANETWLGRGRHVAYAAGWKKFERLWDVLIQGRRLGRALPVLEGVLSGAGRLGLGTASEAPDAPDAIGGDLDAPLPPVPVAAPGRRPSGLTIGADADLASPRVVRERAIGGA